MSLLSEDYFEKCIKWINSFKNYDNCIIIHIFTLFYKNFNKCNDRITNLHKGINNANKKSFEFIIKRIKELDNSINYDFKITNNIAIKLNNKIKIDNERNIELKNELIELKNEIKELNNKFNICIEQNKLLFNKNNLLNNKISDLENNNKILSNIIDNN